MAGVFWLVAQALAHHEGGWVVAAAAGLASVAGSLVFLGVRHFGSVRVNRKYRLLGEVSAEVNRAILLNEDEGKIFSTILDYAFRIFDYVNMGTVLTLDEDGYLKIAASRGLDESYVRNFKIKLTETWQYKQTNGEFTDALIVTPQTIHKAGHKFDDWTWEYRSVMSTPLSVGGRLYGLLNVDSYRERTFKSEDVEVMRWFRAQIEVCLLARDRFRRALADSRRDGLTKFLSRAAFDQQFAQVLGHAHRYREVFTVGMFDVDGLKKVNDHYGHGGGDRLLTAVSQTISKAARRSDLMGRYGGDEFIAIFHKSTAQQMVERFDRLLDALRLSPPLFHELPLAASFCFGFADYPTDGVTTEALIAAADRRLYAMKAARETSP